ncbi:hypothetical protein RIF29_15073 [Crotalaria pallida]|uniref:non-specific serine/threonine protein kinase n=1 Tax=Crotalaria pallida TaxID=3830 RepID=A0AAN9FCX9_CROPI
MQKPEPLFLFPFLLLFSVFVLCAQSQDDAAIMNTLKKALKPPTALNWTDTDFCNWKHTQCNGERRVKSIQIGSLNLEGTLPPELVNLSALETFQCNANQLSGTVPKMPNSLQHLVINNNNFNSMANEFFKGMTGLVEVRIDFNPFQSWTIPDSLKDCQSLISFSGMSANFNGRIPSFFGINPVLLELHLSYNHLEGELPESFAGSNIESLWLNNQNITKLNGTLAVLTNMTSLKQVWVQSNSFTGMIPDFSNHDQLSFVNLRDNQLTGLVPDSLVKLPALRNVTLTNNCLQGPTPKFGDGVVVDMANGSNSFCTNEAGKPCSSNVTLLLSVVEPLGYPLKLAQLWKGDDACANWEGVFCTGPNITRINFQYSGFSGTISPKFGNLTFLKTLLLKNNNLTGRIPSELASLPYLTELDVSNNNLCCQVPVFRKGVSLITAGNPDIGKDLAPPPGSGSGDNSGGKGNKHNAGVIVGVVVGVVILLGVGVVLFIKFGRKRKHGSKFQSPNAIVVHPRRSGDGNDLKVSVADGAFSPSTSVQNGEGGNMVISIQVLREVTGNFSERNILGKGGFGTVYKGELHDGTKIAVKRMESGIMGEKGLSEFMSEIAVLTKVRHKHLVALLGHCLDGNERLLVYEYMPQGTLSQHLFDRKDDDGSKPLDWKRRLIIALDVARGVEYLHSLAQQIFIHRDLKPSNILLGDDMRAKVSDFGLVRLAPEGQASFETRVAGTFGYLAPEYAVTGRVTTKVDVYSYGVILMEMITGRKAIDNSQPEENMHLVTWFRRMLLNKESFQKIIDPEIDVDDGALDSLRTVADLAGHCCSREPYQRPDMSHVVNVLSPLVEIWKPTESSPDDIYGIDLDMSLPHLINKWQQLEGSSTMNASSSTLFTSDNTQTSVAPPDGFGRSFNTQDGR